MGKESIDKMEKRIKELEQLTQKNLRDATEIYNIAIINKYKVKEMQKKLKRCKNEK